MDPVKFAVVGLGMGRNRSRMIHQTEGAELTLVVDLDEERARGVGEELGVPWSLSLDDALSNDEIEVVFVMTPSGTHADVGMQVARAGKHVITTKPMDVSVEACTRLIRACEDAGVHLLVDFQSRYVQGNIAVQKAVSDGWLGKPILGEFRFKWFRSQDYYDDRGGWRGTWKMDGGGSLANQGVHGLDLLTWVMGPVKSVYARTYIANHEIETEDLGLVMLEFENGAHGAITTTTTFPGIKGDGPYYSLEVHGSEGGVLLDDCLAGTGRFLVPEDVQQRIDAVPNPVTSIAEDAIQVIRHGAKPTVDGREGRSTIALLEAIYRSAREDRPVPVEYPTD